MEDHSGNYPASTITGKWSVGRCGYMAESLTDDVCCISRFGIILASYNCILPVLFRKKKRKKKTVLYVKRTIGSILAACVLTVCIWGSVMITETKGTIDDITDNVVTTDTVSAYVMKDDPAETVEDAKDYIFAITEKISKARYSFFCISFLYRTPRIL